MRLNSHDEATAELIRQNVLLLRRDSVQSKMSRTKNNINLIQSGLFQDYYYDGTDQSKGEPAPLKQSKSPGTSVNTSQILSMSTSNRKYSGL